MPRAGRPVKSKTRVPGSPSARSASSGGIRTRSSLAEHPARHVPPEHEADPAEHLALAQPVAEGEDVASALGKGFVIGHASKLSRFCVARYG